MKHECDQKSRLVQMERYATNVDATHRENYSRLMDHLGKFREDVMDMVAKLVEGKRDIDSLKKNVRGIHAKIDSMSAKLNTIAEKLDGVT